MVSLQEAQACSGQADKTEYRDGSLCQSCGVKKRVKNQLFWFSLSINKGYEAHPRTFLVWKAQHFATTSVATARLDSASAWSPRLFQIGKTEPRLMAGLRLNHGLTSQNGYEEISYKYGKILIWASSNNTLDIQNTF